MKRWNEIARLESLDLTRFLRDTASIDREPGERLRHLAIFLESPLAIAEQPRGWLALDRIYVEAIRLDPGNVDLYVSRAVSAHECAEHLRRPETPRGEWNASPVRRRMMSVAHASIHEALSLDPEAADVVRRVGDLLYFDPDHTPAEALEWYDRALALDANESWAALFRAHCLQDLERWREAALAYDAVDAGFFVRNLAWRYELLLEQRAYCWMRAGETERARSEFEAILARWTRDPKLTVMAYGGHLEEAAGVALPEQKRDQIRSVLGRSHEP